MMAPIGGDDDPDGDDVFGPEMVERRAGDDREAGVGVIVQAESELTPRVVNPNEPVSSGIITPGAERMAYWPK